MMPNVVRYSMYATGAFLLWVLLHSCTPKITVQTSVPAPYPPNPTGQIRIGLAQTDLTPPPGYPMMGYAIAGRFSRGMFNRLYCTSLALQDTAGTALIVVATDLWGMPQGFKRRVVQMVQEAGAPWLGEEDILMTSIHTHHGPAGYVPDKAYALGSLGFAFNPPLFHFLTHRVAQAVLASVNDLQQPRQTPRTLHFGSASVADVVTNRSIPAFLRNPREERTSMSDSTVALLVVREGSATIGALAHMSIHPTAIGETGEIYSSDIFGMARDQVSELDSAGRPRLIFGFVNGADGDQAPKHVNVHGLSKAQAMSRSIAATMRQILASDLTRIDGPIEHYFQNVSLAAQPVPVNPVDADCYCTPQGAVSSTASSALAGVALLGGATDGLTEFYFMGMRDGVRDETGCIDGQGPKLDAAAFAIDSILDYGINGEVGNLVANAIQTSPLEETSVSIHRIGTFTFIGCPGEPSLTLGRRIVDSVQTRFGESGTYLFCGLADDYVSYMTTPCEYAEQAYEGASMYWGPNMGMHIASSLGQLAERPPLRADQRAGVSLTYTVGNEAPFGSNVIARQRKWNALVSMRPYVQGALVTHHLFKPGAASNTVTVVRGDSSVVRIQFRSDYADLDDRGRPTFDRVVPDWAISKGRERLQCALTNDEIVQHGTVVDWSLWIFNPSDLDPGSYPLTITALDGSTRPCTLVVR